VAAGKLKLFLDSSVLLSASGSRQSLYEFVPLSRSIDVTAVA
jgi:hypothetical protein